MRVLIVDDEPLARDKLRRLLGAVPEITLVGEAGSGAEALRMIRETAPELVFLDVDMADMSGFDVVAAFDAESPPLIVFATAYDSFAIQAFEVHAVDYLLKPFDAERLEATLRQARSTLAARRGPGPEQLAELFAELRSQRVRIDRALQATSVTYAQRVMVPRGQELVPVAVETLDWIAAADNYVEVHVGAETHLLRETLRSVETRLDPRRFLRIHRGVIVHLARVRAVSRRPDGDYEVVLEDGVRLPVGRAYRAGVSARWQGATPDAPAGPA